VLPEEVVVAATVAANVPPGSPMPALLATAGRALEVTLPQDGPFWRSWVDDDREAALAAVAEVTGRLRAAAN
jgi:hypothetical protein